MRRLAAPSPAIFTAFSTEEWASAEQYAANAPAPARPVSLMRQSLRRSRALKSAHRVAAEAVSWMTPTKPSGRPIMRRSQSRTRVSISVAAGEVCHSMHCAPSAAVSISASTAGGLELAGK